jgi:hypothetical protein
MAVPCSNLVRSSLQADKKPRKSWFGLGKKSSDNDGPGGENVSLKRLHI